ncbi:hypothetical protein K503DRAFT_832877 [Rhizopogon vinicolor AM-OR11-026]|uniref:Uncharacterized protein n=1 Tax=Rhizopogon vinicolor AM-OR11-026 TaxID=1314800 RepID=A0A1B7NAS2_9AGAM|nr:hypothetical protein K503DRAFT_832877 [Rhizopogon vinicolor AM-OR11-026]
MPTEEYFDDSKCDNLPLSYDAIVTSALSELELKDSAKKRRAAVLTLIREVVRVSATPFPFTSERIKACSDILPGAEFSDLLQTPNIEGHTAMYWAIVNNRREAFSALAVFIPKFSFKCVSDLRLACMITSDNTLFTELHLGKINAKEESFRSLLCCTPDVIEVYELGNNKFITCFQIMMFQKRMRAAQKVGNLEFVAGGRIWWLCFDMHKQRWRVEWGLAEDSFPARLNGVLKIKTHETNSGSSLEIKWETSEDSPEKGLAFTDLLGDWIMDKDTKYVDCQGTLHVDMEVICN